MCFSSVCVCVCVCVCVLQQQSSINMIYSFRIGESSLFEVKATVIEVSQCMLITNLSVLINFFSN